MRCSYEICRKSDVVARSGKQGVVGGQMLRAGMGWSPTLFHPQGSGLGAPRGASVAPQMPWTVPCWAQSVMNLRPRESTRRAADAAGPVAALGLAVVARD